MSIPLSAAIAELRNELRKAILEKKSDEGIIFVPQEIELELGVTLETEAKAGGGFKFFVVADVSTEAKISRSSEHKVKLKLQVTDNNLQPIKVSSTDETEH